ncbi:Nitrate reductase, gamma subunit [Magnetococcus marinus MC-1]|uniref:Nitrate reductase, gamma subunit n=1 Tax=Magnetococcus marinus (strain ATCC BAA-1437 / JCM 17883 / MC-1) TaxID=156889 RepID=A0L3N5_MAGMM|nr:respiratory nitrate reductase subunit gamma [Magnetococcus marinus]ABK42578.1 Nitrate reductase, gamma subunit [Magnetococcus marinus MC-1]
MLMILAYLALGIFVVGILARIVKYARTPAPLKIPTTPAPLTKQGVAWRLFTEVAFFNSLFKGDKWTWMGGYLFHVALALVTLRHLRYFVEDIPEVAGHFQIVGIVAGIAMVGGLGFLFLRRLMVDRFRHISSKADYLILLLLMAIGGSGLLMTFAIHPDVVEIKAAMMGWLGMQGFETPSDVVFLLHFLLVLALMIIFPFSKLMHMVGIFFSPTRNQTDTPREAKHVNPWSKY